MTVQNILGGLWLPRPITNHSGTLQYGSLAMSDSDDKYSIVCQVPKTGTILKIHFRTGTVTTGDTVQGGIYNLDSSGDPDLASAYGGMAVGTVAIADGDDNVVKTITLATGATVVNADDEIAICLVFSSYVAGNITIATITAGGANQQNFPYVDRYTTAWAKSSAIPLVVLEYSDGSFAPISGVWPFISAFASTSFNSGSGDDQYALKFTLPFKASLRGFGGMINSTGACDFILYDSDGSSVLKTYSKPANLSVAAASRQSEYLFASAQVLNANTAYRLALKPTSATNVGLFIGDVASAAMMDSVDLGQNAILSTKDGAGAWADVTTRRPLINLLFDGMDDGAGGAGGLLSHPGMSGRMAA